MCGESIITARVGCRRVARRPRYNVCLRTRHNSASTRSGCSREFALMPDGLISQATHEALPRRPINAVSSRATRRPGIEVSGIAASHSRVTSSTLRIRNRRLLANWSWTTNGHSAGPRAGSAPGCRAQRGTASFLIKDARFLTVNRGIAGEQVSMQSRQHLLSLKIRSLHLSGPQSSRNWRKLADYCIRTTDAEGRLSPKPNPLWHGRIAAPTLVFGRALRAPTLTASSATRRANRLFGRTYAGSWRTDWQAVLACSGSLVAFSLTLSRIVGRQAGNR